jgi:hypothetical protein
MKGPAGIMPAAELSSLKPFDRGFTSSQPSTMLGTSSRSAKHASYSPPSHMHPHRSYTPSPSPGPSCNGASIRSVPCPSHLEVTTRTCSSPWINSPSGSKLSLSQTKKQLRQSSSLSQSSSDMAYRTASSPTTAPTSHRANFKSLPRSSASRSSTPRWRTPSPTAKSKRPMGSSARD